MGTPVTRSGEEVGCATEGRQVPGAIYHDRASIFEPALRQPLTL